ncbi:MAG: hypothetical protein WCD70_04175 [Alphaproteobacteria bacterium]
MIQNVPKGTNGIEEGALFRRGVGGSMTEIAEVAELVNDRMGIPHVRYSAYLMRGHYKASPPEQRTLALESFNARYKERIPAGENP